MLLRVLTFPHLVLHELIEKTLNDGHEIGLQHDERVVKDAYLGSILQWDRSHRQIALAGVSLLGFVQGLQNFDHNPLCEPFDLARVELIVDSKRYLVSIFPVLSQMHQDIFQ